MNLTKDEWDILLQVVDDWIIEAIKSWKVKHGVTDDGRSCDETIDLVQSLLTKLSTQRAAEAGGDRV
jgi:hypothetical protein